MLEILLVILWIGSGILSIGVENHYFRFRYHTLYIEDYYSGKEVNAACRYGFTQWLYYAFCIIAGPIGLLLSLIMAREEIGLCYVFRKWTQEEAKVLFPHDYKFRYEV